MTDGPLIKGKDGSVKWSGTVMISEIAEGSTTEQIDEGETVIIKSVKGNRLFVDKL